MVRQRVVDESDPDAVAHTRMWHAIRANFSPDVHDREVTIEAARRHNEAVIAGTRFLGRVAEHEAERGRD